MSLSKFIKALKRDVFKIDEKTQRVVTPETVVAESWESYRHRGAAQLMPTPPLRYHGQYSTPLDSLGTAGKYMSRQFNAYCSEAGVECTVQMDPTDFRQLFHFTNRSDKLVRIEYDNYSYYLEPNHSTTCKVNQRFDGEPNIPRLTPLNNGA